MKNILLIIAISFLFSCSQKIYIVRHGEKEVATANMSSDVPLSKLGTQRAEALKEALRTKKIQHVFSTKTIRTESTARPTADFFKLAIETYSPRPDTAFINLLKSTKGNLLVVGHSNTVDDIANMLMGKTVVAGDLDESQYDNLFVVKRKGKKYSFERKKYGVPSQR